MAADDPLTASDCSPRQVPEPAPAGRNVPFSRIQYDKIEFEKSELADNSWAALRAAGHTYADKAQARLGPVKGKAFQKEMTKAKRGTYRGGVLDTNQVNSIKF
jgi:hypothetical protein